MENYAKRREFLLSKFHNKEFEKDFDSFAVEVFNFQYTYCPIYKEYCKLLGKSVSNVKNYPSIPFLPISFFKSHSVKSGEWKEETVFRSSGTTNSTRSKHYVRDNNFYEKHAIEQFEAIYGPSKDYCIVGILPGYTGRNDSSLIVMVNQLIKNSQFRTSDYYLNRDEEMLQLLSFNEENNIPTIIFGVSFALLELCKYRLSFPNLIVIETGGMKSSNIDLTKEAIIDMFNNSWNIKRVDSEYGMTELFSQAYAVNSDWYSTSECMKIEIGQLNDPFEFENEGKVGLIKVCDLANIDTCSFIETEDLGIKNESGLFKILGRSNNSELRGCNLLLEEL